MGEPQPPTAPWPTAEEAAGARWFSPIALGPVSLSQRTWVPAMVTWRSAEGGFVNDDLLDFYGRMAEGQPGALVVEATGVRDIPSGPLLRANSGECLDGLSRLAERIHEKSGGKTRCFIQLIDFLPIRRRPTKEKFFRSFLALDEEYRRGLAQLLNDDSLCDASDAHLREVASSLEDSLLEKWLRPRDWEAYRRGARQRVTDVDIPSVLELPRLLPDAFSRAALLCQRAGFDGIELHAAHAYTLASFLSALNDRQDGYGGSLENRARCPLEVFAAVRGAVSSKMAVGVRLLADETIPGGHGPSDAAFFAARFAEEGIHWLSFSRGGKFEDAKQPRVGWPAYPYTGPSGAECMPTRKMGHLGRNLAAVAQVTRGLRACGLQTPVVACGGVSSFWQAEEILSAGTADIVAAARQTLADPDWFMKIRAGKGEDIRRCLYSNYCEGLDQAHKRVTCQLWDEAGKRALPPPWVQK